MTTHDYYRRVRHGGTGIVHKNTARCWAPFT
jgi:hypothetical protein